MCGRFVTPDEAEIERFWHIGRHNWKSPFSSIRHARFNVPPQQGAAENHILAIRADPDGYLELTDFQWWLLPSWSKEPTTSYSTFNARVENVATSASFKTPFRRHRCLIPARGWYEWQATPSGKQPWYFHNPDGSLLAFAGIWDRWERGDQVIESCAIVVGESPPSMSHLHNRAPFLIPPERQKAWLDPNLTDAELVRKLLLPPPEGSLIWHKVSKAVGNVRNQEPELSNPIVPE